MADQTTIAAITEALEDEYRARAIYQKVIEAFGPVRPFVNIVEAEDRHARALLTLFAQYGVEPPPDTWPGRVLAPASLLDACRAAVQAEIDNEEMYERLLRGSIDPSAVAVLRNLQRASRERRLPAFRRCVAREEGGGGPASAPRARHRRGAR